jgi:ubiquinone/menaquinone biosynthesis C-methylase UbiE
LALRGRKGLEAAVGGHFDPVGARERDIADRAGLQPDHYLVDVGCGSGRLAAALKGRPHLRYLGLDVAPALLERAAALCERPDWRFERVYGPVIPEADAVADMVTMFSLITHLPAADTRAYLREARRVLKPGGAALVSFLDPAVAEYRKQIRPPIVEAIVTRIAWAPNVATRQEDLRAWAAEAGLAPELVESPSPFGQALAVLRKPD